MSTSTFSDAQKIASAARYWTATTPAPGDSHVREGESLPRGVVVDGDNTYDAESGELIAD